MVRLETQSSGNGVSSDWQKLVVERLKQHGLALQDANSSFQKWADTQAIWVEKIQCLETTQQSADVQIQTELGRIGNLLQAGDRHSQGLEQWMGRMELRID